jgi:uncharacterized membrane protein (UPF0127 family)
MEPDPSVRSPLYVLPIGSDPDGGVERKSLTLAYAELAFTPRDRANGLMGRRSLPKDTGMLFIYPVAEERSFWMKNTLIPLSIAFAEEGGRIVRILEMTPDPGDGRELRHYKSGEDAIYALEMEQGWFERNGIGEGDRMLFHPSILAIRPR